MHPKLRHFIVLILPILLSEASDPDPVQDYCIPNPNFNPTAIMKSHSLLLPSALPCKNASEITAHDFVFSGMKHLTPNFSDTGLSALSVGPAVFPGLSTLGMSFSRAELNAGGVNPPHFHPRATEIAFVMRGRVYSGFVDSANRVFARVIEAGEVTVYPRGLVHFQMNVGDNPAVIFGSFNSQNPGTQKIPVAMFGSGIDDELLEKAFGMNSKQVGLMRRKFDPKKASSGSHVPVSCPVVLFCPTSMDSHTRPLVSSLNLLLLLSLLTGHWAVEGSSRHHLRITYSSRQVHAFRPTKLFVFGDSYADTGNIGKAESNSWKVPYGITFPGKPSGRFSSGRVLTDYFAKSFRVRSPIPYKWRRLGAQHLQYGMNFAYGGTGVFNTLVPLPNMTAQISLLEQLIKDKTFSVGNMKSSVALVTLSGNDYFTYNTRNGTVQSLPAFIESVIIQLSKNLRQLYELGVKKVAVAALQPLGCLPVSTAVNSFQSCNDTVNLLVGIHNQLLRQAVDGLNNQTHSSTFIIVDLYSSFMSVLDGTGGHSKFEKPLTPCCVGISSGYNCGSVDGNGSKMYTVCEDPESTFFWDMVHPTQAGWQAVFSSILPTLSAALNF
ncbi:hypothetical protein SAY86_022595 [Trapa natans]|uniref:Cupin type-1 domain-containing protein n=1 Tax=Trapa natans TaxID=22666 RepID=A0AAN7M9C5_TRANT|nr:hypothetical protein SAY86_022595 [Trapa natans]